MNDFNISETTAWLGKIFDLQDQVMAKQLKIITLEFELALSKQMLEAINKTTVKDDEYVS